MKMLKLSQTKEARIKEDCDALRVVMKGLQDTIQNQCNLRVELKEEEHKKLMEKKDIEILELSKQLRTQEKERQSEIIKLQIEFNAKLARIQHKTAKSYPDTAGLPQNIYRMKLQHLQEEKNKEIEILRRTIRDLEQQIRDDQGSHLKRKQF
uniref:Coiled-coil domain-containing protein 152 n=1 Tax=Geotrypetes seraphini TaxID=260995 RepID=A0A6P8QSC9_GEOSA|nr:coiled-coil domain-containing protein 152 [Geotrypetes seraphini]